MAVGVMTPLNWISPIRAEAQKTAIFRKPGLDLRKSVREARMRRSHAKEFEWIIQLVDGGHLQPSASDVFQAIFAIDKMIKPHASPEVPTVRNPVYDGRI